MNLSLKQIIEITKNPLDHLGHDFCFDRIDPTSKRFRACNSETTWVTIERSGCGENMYTLHHLGAKVLEWFHGDRCNPSYLRSKRLNQKELNQIKQSWVYEPAWG